MPDDKKPPLTEAERQARTREDLRDAGGRTISLNLSPQAVADLDASTRRLGLAGRGAQRITIETALHRLAQG